MTLDSLEQWGPTVITTKPLKVDAGLSNGTVVVFKGSLNLSYKFTFTKEKFTECFISLCPCPGMPLSLSTMERSLMPVTSGATGSPCGRCSRTESHLMETGLAQR